MNLKLLVGIVLFVIGIVTAGAGIAGVWSATPGPDVSIRADHNEGALETAGGYALPVIAGLSLSVGGLLIGLSMGNWKHPRTTLEHGDEVVNPEGYQKMKHV
jgi:hypothetical protein